MISKNFDFWSREFWLPEGVDWEHIEDYEKEENLKAANVQDLIPVIYLTIGLYFARIVFEKSIGKITASLMGVKVRKLKGSLHQHEAGLKVKPKKAFHSKKLRFG